MVSGVVRAVVVAVVVGLMCALTAATAEARGKPNGPGPIGTTLNLADAEIAAAKADSADQSAAGGDGSSSTVTNADGTTSAAQLQNVVQKKYVPCASATDVGQVCGLLAGAQCTPPAKRYVEYTMKPPGPWVFHGTVCLSPSQAAQAALPPPQVIAHSVFTQMHFENLDVGFEPSEGTGLVGLPAWVWVNNAGPHATEDQTVRQAAYGMDVEIDAHFVGITWDMGDGTTLSGCQTPGTPYAAKFDTADSPTGCSHRYAAPGTYTIAATPQWDVTWRIARLGATGNFQAPVQTTSEQVTFAEMQVLNR